MKTNTNKYKPVMTFHESFGDIPRAMLALFKQANVSQADFDLILCACGWEWNSPAISWEVIYNHITSNLTESGMYTGRIF